MRAVVWPTAGVSAMVETEEPVAGPDEVAIDVAVSVVSPGTERARFLSLPTAEVPFPHLPGYLAAGSARAPGPFAAGTRVAVRGGGHRVVAVAPAGSVRAVPDHVPLPDAALWQLALTALYGLALGEHRPGEPVTVVGAGLLGVILRRLLAAGGAPDVLAVAGSTAKAWATAAEPATRFATADRVVPVASLTFDVTGTAAGLATAIAATGAGGRVVLLGSPRADAADVPLRRAYDQRIRIIGAHVVNLAGADEPPLSDAFFELLVAGRFTLGDVLTEHPAEEAPALYRRLVEDRSFIGATLRWAPDRPEPAARTGTPTTRRATPAARTGTPATRRATPAARTGTPATRRATPAARTGAAGGTRPLRFGLIGCGDIGIKDAEAVAGAAGAELVACHDPLRPLADEVAGRYGARATPDVAALLAGRDVDAVLIATPHDTHEPLALAALAAGKHVLLEKPLAHDLASARRIAAAAATSGTLTSVLFPMRTDTRFARARAALDGGLVGTPLGVMASYLVDKPATYFHGGFSQRARSSWRLSRARAGGGFVIMNLVHQLDAIRALLGVEADRVFADLTPAAAAPEIEDVVTVVVRFGSTIATLVGGASVPGGDGQRLCLWGDAGQLRLLPDFALTTRSPAPEHPPPPDGDARVLAIDRFVASVRYGTPPDVGVDDALAVQAIVDAAYASARAGRAVSPTAPVAGGRP